MVRGSRLRSLAGPWFSETLYAWNKPMKVGEKPPTFQHLKRIL